MMAAILAAIGVGVIVLLCGIAIGLAVAEISERRHRRAVSDLDHEMIQGRVP